MNEFVVSAAGHLGPDGYGSTLDIRRRWPAVRGASSRILDPGRLCWPREFAEACPRFGRMDSLSKAAVLAVELLRPCFEDAGETERREIGVGIETCTGSLDVDVRFIRQESPSVFVYTLPSIALGEICIRHRFMGPVTCFLSDTGGRRVLAECLRWLRAGEARSAVCVCCETVCADSARVSGCGRDRDGFPWEAACLYVEQCAGSNRDAPVIVAGMEGATVLDVCRHHALVS